MLSFFPRGVLNEILSLIESVSEDFPSYSVVNLEEMQYETLKYNRGDPGDRAMAMDDGCLPILKGHF